MKNWLLVLLAVGAALALALLSWGNGATAARGWLCAFVLVSMVPIGSLALLLVCGISGGRWGDDLAPVLEPAARAIPLLILAFLPVIAFRSSIYDWNALGLPRDVRSYYLNPLFFDARTLIGLTIWSALAWTNAWRNQLFAALGLVAHFILMTFLPADWVLTIQPGSASAGFGMGFGIEQMFAALGLAAALAWQSPGRATRDLAGILVTTLLGAVYFFYMAFLITWYGNVPEKVHWYVARVGNGWPAVMLLSFLIGAAAPFVAILNPYVRRQPTALRFVGFLILIGVVLHIAWMTVPSFGAIAIAPALFASVLLSLLIAAMLPISPAPGSSDGH